MVGDVCVFQYSTKEFRIVRVLQFCKFENRKMLTYKGNYSLITKNNGVLCTLYAINSSGHCNMLLPVSKSEYFPTSTYLCTLTEACIQVHDDKRGKTALWDLFHQYYLSLINLKLP